MLKSKEYLPIGSVVLLKGGFKKVMIIGIMQYSIIKGEKSEEYDYIGVIYPEGFMNMETMLLFNNKQINDVIFKGYENPEREDFIKVIERAHKKETEVKEL